MHAHPAEVMAEARLEEGPRGGIERLARCIQHVVDNGRRFHCRGASARCPALRERAPALVVGSVHSGIRHPHDLFRDPIGFLFIHIVRLSDRELHLHGLSM
jgi:hypothetical protein